MKLVTLNIWGGKRSDVVIKLGFTRIVKRVSFACRRYSAQSNLLFQTIIQGDCPDIYEKILEVLPNHQGVYCPLFRDGYGLATLVHKSITITDFGPLSVVL